MLLVLLGVYICIFMLLMLRLGVSVLKSMLSVLGNRNFIFLPLPLLTGILANVGCTTCLLEKHDRYPHLCV